MATINCGFPDSAGLSGHQLLAVIGPTLHVDIGFDAAFRPSKDPLGVKTDPRAQITDVPALVDTGASESCIDSLLAMTLELPVVDRQVVAGSGGAHEVNVHLAQIRIPSLSYTIYGRFAAVNLSEGGQTHRALLGRTFLRAVTMAYDGRTGEVSITL